MHSAFYQIVFILALKAVVVGSAAAEEFKYYVWVDEEGIVHAEEKAPKGRDYQVRIIEDINANVVPAEDFRLYGELPIDYGSQSEENRTAPADAGAAQPEPLPEPGTEDLPAPD